MRQIYASHIETTCRELPSRGFIEGTSLKGGKQAITDFTALRVEHSLPKTRFETHFLNARPRHTKSRFHSSKSFLCFSYYLWLKFLLNETTEKLEARREAFLCFRNGARVEKESSQTIEERGSGADGVAEGKLPELFRDATVKIALQIN